MNNDKESGKTVLPFTTGYIVWPEGEPQRAKFARTGLRRNWLMLGPMGLLASLRGKRMSSYQPAVRGEDYTKLASNMERALALHRKVSRASEDSRHG